MSKKTKILAIILAVVLVAAIVVVTGVCIKKSNENAVKAENAAFISTAIRAMSDSEFKDLELARRIYIHAFSKSSVFTDCFAENADGTLELLLSGKATTELKKAVVANMYGGKNIKSAIEGIEGEPSNKVKEKDLYVGDLLLLRDSKGTKNYIMDKNGLVDLSNATAKVDTEGVLKSLADCEVFAVFRVRKIIDDYDFITEKSPKLDLTPEQEAVIETAKSFLLRGDKLQYSDTRMGSSIDSEFRWKAGQYSPEYYTSQNWGYTNCAAFTYDVYYNALDLDLHKDFVKLHTTYNLTNYSEELGIRKYFIECETADSYTEEEKAKIEKEIMATLQPADILVVRRANGNGHAMLYIGNENIIHSSGGVYNYNEAKETYDATVRQMRFKDYFFTPGAGGYIFGSDTGSNVLSFAIVRPLATFEGEIPEVTQNRVKNMKGIMAQKLSTHNIAKTVNRGEEITFTFEIYNTNEEEVTLDIYDTVPSHTTYVSGAETVNGDNLSWKVTIPANSRKKVNYTVKVNDEAVIGGSVRSKNSTVGGVPVECPAITINRTLNEQEQDKISKELEKTEAYKDLKGFEIVNKVYKNALGVENIFTDTEFKTVYSGSLDGVFYSYGPVALNGVTSHRLTSEGKYRDMLIPTLYGGRNYVTTAWSNRTRLAREHNLVVGDILIRKTTQQEQIFIYAGDGKFYNLTDGFALDAYSANVRLETCLATGNSYAILRPSFSMK